MGGIKPRFDVEIVLKNFQPILVSRYNYGHLQCDPAMLAEVKNMTME